MEQHTVEHLEPPRPLIQHISGSNGELQAAIDAASNAAQTASAMSAGAVNAFEDTSSSGSMISSSGDQAVLARPTSSRTPIYRHRSNCLHNGESSGRAGGPTRSRNFYRLHHQPTIYPASGTSARTRPMHPNPPQMPPQSSSSTSSSAYQTQQLSSADPRRVELERQRRSLENNRRWYLARRLGAGDEAHQRRLAFYNFIRGQRAAQEAGTSAGSTAMQSHPHTPPVSMPPPPQVVSSPMQQASLNYWSARQEMLDIQQQLQRQIQANMQGARPSGSAPDPLLAMNAAARAMDEFDGDPFNSMVLRRRTSQLVMPPSLATLIVYQVEMSSDNAIRRKNIRDNIAGLLETVLFSSVSVHAETDEGANCVICREEFGNDDKVTKLMCSHVFHTECIEPWVAKEPTCPLCRQELLSWLEDLIKKKEEKARRQREESGKDEGVSGSSSGGSSSKGGAEGDGGGAVDGGIAVDNGGGAVDDGGGSVDDDGGTVGDGAVDDGGGAVDDGGGEVDDGGGAVDDGGGAVDDGGGAVDDGGGAVDDGGGAVDDGGGAVDDGGGAVDDGGGAVVDGGGAGDGGAGSLDDDSGAVDDGGAGGDGGVSGGDAGQVYA